VTHGGKWGDSPAVRLPASIIEALDLKEGDEIEIELAGDLTPCVDRDRPRGSVVSSQTNGISVRPRRLVG
jgi:antitoxin MazE